MVNEKKRVKSGGGTVHTTLEGETRVLIITNALQDSPVLKRAKEKDIQQGNDLYCH